MCIRDRATKPAVKQEAEEKKAAEEKTYGDTNAPTTLSKKAQAAANNVVKIINNSANALKVILRDLKAVSYTHLDVYKRQGQCGNL